MPASFSLDLVSSKSVRSAREEGALTDNVYVQFLCNTGPGGEHDPSKPPDEHVRPSHAAYHGQIFKMSEAPVPPLDYGCRCAVRYVAKDGTAAADVIETTTDESPVKPAVATAQWLDANVDEWKAVAREAKSAGPKEMLATAVNEAKDRDIPQPRSIAEMIIDVIRHKLL